MGIGADDRKYRRRTLKVRRTTPSICPKVAQYYAKNGWPGPLTPDPPCFAHNLERITAYGVRVRMTLPLYRRAPSSKLGGSA